MNNFFNAIVSCLVVFTTLNSQKKPTSLPGLCPLKAYQGSAPDLKLQLRSLCNRFFPYKTQCSSTKWTLVKVLG